jgi:hypothetical protein
MRTALAVPTAAALEPGFSRSGLGSASRSDPSSKLKCESPSSLSRVFKKRGRGLFPAARCWPPTPTHVNRTIASLELIATNITTYTSSLRPPAAQRSVQEAFLIGFAMRKALSIQEAFLIGFAMRKALSIFGKKLIWGTAGGQSGDK